MNKFFLSAFTLLMALSSLNGFSQKLKLTDGDLAFLKNEKTINLVFTYNNLAVGKYDNEKDYVNDKKETMNKKNPGTGDKWANAWKADQEDRYRDQFVELFEKECPSLKTEKDGNSKYTILYNTTFLEPGYNIGISRKNAQHNAVLTIVETANKSKVLATITVDKALGRDFWGADFDTGYRLSETYADAGKAIGQFFTKKIK